MSIRLKSTGGVIWGTSMIPISRNNLFVFGSAVPVGITWPALNEKLMTTEDISNRQSGNTAQIIMYVFFNLIF